MGRRNANAWELLGAHTVVGQGDGRKTAGRLGNATARVGRPQKEGQATQAGGRRSCCWGFGGAGGRAEQACYKAHRAQAPPIAVPNNNNATIRFCLEEERSPCLNVFLGVKRKNKQHNTSNQPERSLQPPVSWG